MKLTAQIKLNPTNKQSEILLNTLERVNEACNFISEIAWDTKVFGQFKLHHLVYNSVRDDYSLSAQVTIRAIAKVVDTYKLDRKTKHTFRKHGSICYDNRILTYNMVKNIASIWTLEGSQKIPMIIH